VTILNNILKQDPPISDGFFALGNVYFKARKFAEALNPF